MKVDTEIRHLTKTGPNFFLELAGWIELHHLKQAEVADMLMVSRPRVSDVVNKKTAKFTIDTLF